MIDFKSKLGYVPLLILDDGHGMETAGKRTPPFPDGTVIRENQFNRAVVTLIEKDAKRLGFKTLLVAPEDTDTPLQVRTDRANAAWADYVKQLESQGIRLKDPKKAAVFYSQHYNALLDNWDGSTAQGSSVHYYPGSVEGKWLASCILKYVIQGTQQQNRGVVANNFHVLRETKMYAALGEAGFMDDPREAALMLNPAFQKETATQVLMGICEYYGLTYEAEQTKPAGTAIVAAPRATVGQAQAWAKQKGATELFISLASIFWRLAPSIGVDPVVAYTQSAKETGLGKFGGVLDASYMNPCGMKKKEGGGDYDKEAHQRFGSWEQGIQAQLDHLALYAGVSGYPKASTPDPRHFDFIKGTAATVEALGGKWAPSASYGTDILKMMGELQATKEPPKEEKPAADNWKYEGINGLADAGLLSDREGWSKKIDEPMPVWAAMLLLYKVLKQVKGDA